MTPQNVKVADLLAHQPPMRLVDRLVEVYDNGVKCEVDIAPSNPFATDNGVPAYTAIEYMAQTIGVYDGWGCLQRNCVPRIGYLVGTRQLVLSCEHFSFGQCLEVEARMIWDGEKMLQFECSVTDKTLQERLASATINVFSPMRESTEG
ncbi:MAG: 3-hydroxylacyl-ACP dehydratase [Deltaproteobacteria bacterium]|nr:3-hydroxylacyl-ACP dehydratase [Deltaproteobacteria bacterium]MBN2673288.1 3-hydroxylacyl-ACP dehydratase [Deltaproteobacteria bacterium]